MASTQSNALRAEVPRPLCFPHSSLCRSGTARSPYLIQPITVVDSPDLEGLIRSVRQTIGSHHALSHPWDLSPEGCVVESDPNITGTNDAVHVVTVRSQAPLESSLARIISGQTDLIPCLTNFYIVVDADATPSYLVLVNGVIFHNKNFLHLILEEIQSGYLEEGMRRTATMVKDRQLKEYILAPNLEDSERYWKDYLAEFNKVSFGEPSSQPCVDSLISKSVDLPSGDHISDRLRTIALAAWSTVLSRHVGSEDILVGEALVLSPVFSPLIPVLDLIPRRIRFADSTDYIEQISSQLAKDSEHVGSAWRIAERLLEYDPFYSILEVVQDVSYSLFPSLGRVIHQPFNVSLYLMVSYSSSSPFNLQLNLHFDSDVFAAGDVQYMADHLALAIQHLCEVPGVSHSRINMMSPEERTFMLNLPSLSYINKLPPPEDHKRYRYGQDLISRALSTRPDAVAIEWEGKPLYTYLQLDAVTNKLSRYLTQTLSVCPGDIVVIFSENSPYVVLAIYAILKAGAAYLPLDVEMPGDRLQHAVQMVNSKVLLTIKSMEEKLNDTCPGRNIISLDSVATAWEILDGSPIPQDHMKDPASALAYVNLTSGSTGLPKGCMISHHNLIRFVVDAVPSLGHNVDLRQLQVCKLQFDGIIAEIFVTHYVGGTLCMASTLAMETSLQDVLNSMKVTFVTLTPTLSTVFDPAALPSVKTLAVTGEPLRRHTRDRWLKHGVTLLNWYGPTETVCGFSLENPVRPSTSNETPVGFSMGPNRIYLVDSYLQPVPVGCIGEICVSGPTVGLGYYGDEEKTKAVFVQDPFRPGVRMYRTGDSGRINFEGRLTFLGRRDNQIKLHGFRIELGEIESVLFLSNSPWKTSVDVITFQERSRIAVFLAPRLASGTQKLQLSFSNEAKTTAQQFLEYCRTKLIRQMIPTLWVPMNVLPRTVSGKLDKKALRDFFLGLSREDQDFTADFLVERGEIVAPRSDLEKFLHNLWSSHLNVASERVGVHDSFASLGADSLSTVHLAGILRKAGYMVSPLDLRKYKTIAAIAEVLSSRGFALPTDVRSSNLSLLAETESELAEHGIPLASVADVVPATPFQKGVLLQATSSEDAYMHLIRFTIEKPIDPKRFASSLEGLMSSHPTLRTAFIMTHEHSIVQVVFKSTPRVYTIFTDDSPSVIDAGNVSSIFAHHRWGRVPVHPVLLFNAAGQSELLLFMHHALYDGWSTRLLVNDLATQYDGLGVQTRPPWNDYVRFANSVNNESLAFWKSHLDGVPSSNFCKPKLLAATRSMAEVHRSIDVNLSSTSQKLGVMDSVLMYAAWAFAQYLHTGEDDIVTELVSSGRDVEVPGVLEMIGPCVVNFPLRVNFTNLKTIDDLLRAVESAFIAAHEHAHVGMSAILKSIGHSGPISHIDFVLQHFDSGVNTSQSGASTPWISARRSNFQDAGMSPTVEVYYREDRSGFAIGAMYDKSSILEEEIGLVLDRFGQIVKLAMTNPQLTLDAANFMLPGEQHKVILRDERYVHNEVQLSALDLFLRHVHQRSDELAVDVDGGVGLTFSQLDARSSSYAQTLNGMDLQPGSIVLMYLEKTPELVTSVLSCLKAGIYFCMVSTDCPPERFNFIVGDLKPKLIISTKLSEHPQVAVWNPASVQWNDAKKFNSPTSNPEIDSSTLAYIIMTSGSTGTPKPICISRSNLDALMNGNEPNYHRANKRCLAFSSVNFDVSILDIFGTLCAGGCLCLASDTTMREDLPSVIRRMRVQSTAVAPTVARLLVGEKFDTLEVLTLSGENYTPALRDQLFTTGIKELQSTYAPAECTVECFRDSMGPDTTGTRTVSLGHIFGSSFAVVVDKDLRPVPLGAVGELCIGGPQVSLKGYFNRPELTKKSFISIDLDGKPTRVYRSGDIVRLVPNGTLEFMTRRDRQVKIRGIRIELGEVEGWIRSALPSVAQAAVIPISDSTGERNLAAFVVLVPGVAFDVRSAMDTLRARLIVPPAAILVVPRLPFNLSGKLDVPNLQRIYDQHQQEQYQAPSSQPVHEEVPTVSSVPDTVPFSDNILLVRKLWSGVFGIQEEAIGLDVPFQDLGGDSFKWMQLSIAFARAKKRVALPALMAASTVRLQAALMMK